MGFIQRVKHNYRQIKDALKYKEMYGTFIYVAIFSGIYPNFVDYMYFYLTSADHIGMSTQAYGVIRMLEYLGQFIGAVVYALCLKNLSLRTHLGLAALIMVLEALGNLAFCKGLYFGLPPEVYYGIVMLFGDSSIMCFYWMPTMAAVAKMIPSSVESAVFALFMGLGNLSRLFLSKIVGNWINLYFNVTREDMSNLWKLFMAQAILGLVPLVLVWMLPTTAQV